MGDTRDHAAREDAARRDAEIIRMKREGRTFIEIGEHFGFTKQNAHDLYWKAVNAIPAKELNEYRAELLDRLEFLTEQVSMVLRKDHIAVSNGKVVRLGRPAIDDDGLPYVDDGHGEIVNDDMPKIAAAKELRQLNESVRKLLGADVPVRQEFGGDLTVKHIVEGEGFNPGDLT